MGFVNLWFSELQSANAERVTQWLRLRKFLEEHEISRSLTFKILQSFRWKFHRYMRRVQEGDIEFLNDIPLGLRIALHTELYLLILLRHPLFQVVSSKDRQLPISLGHLA